VPRSAGRSGRFNNEVNYCIVVYLDFLRFQPYLHKFLMFRIPDLDLLIISVRSGSAAGVCSGSASVADEVDPDLGRVGSLLHLSLQ
jgi:hypothetical protein